jgi:hypothetical protein
MKALNLFTSEQCRNSCKPIKSVIRRVNTRECKYPLITDERSEHLKLKIIPQNLIDFVELFKALRVVGIQVTEDLEVTYIGSW